MNKKVGGIIAAVVVVVAIALVLFFTLGKGKQDAKSLYITNLNDTIKEVKKVNDANSVSGTLKVNIGSDVAAYKAFDKLGVNISYGISYKDKFASADATLLDNNENVVSAKAFIQGNRVYVDSKDLLEKVYFMENGEFDFGKYLDEALTKSKETMDIYSSVLEHVKNSLSDNYFTDTTDGDYKVANFILEGENLKSFVNKLMDSIKNDSALMDKLAKLSEESKDSIAKELDDAKKTFEDGSCKAAIKVSSYNKKGTEEKVIATVNNCDAEEVKVEAVQTSKNVYDITLSGSALDGQTFKATVEYNGNSNKPEYKVTTNVMGIKVNATFGVELNGKVNAMNVDNAVNYETMSEAEMNAVMEKVQNNTKLMNIIQRFQNLAA